VRVLVVEDHKVLADRIAEGLRDQGMAVDIAYDGEAALESTAVTGTTSSSWTGTCRGCTVTRCARAW
jgi:DNA-binding NtrC family response regulator